MEFFDNMDNLQTLILSFNELDKIQGLQNCKQLKRLELNHNFIKEIQGLDNKPLL
jgi:Leucine-rich repeat (LRR) protein